MPFGDPREVIVRRGGATAHHYGLEQGRRLVTIAGHEFLVVSYTEPLRNYFELLGLKVEG